MYFISFLGGEHPSYIQFIDMTPKRKVIETWNEANKLKG